MKVALLQQNLDSRLYIYTDRCCTSKLQTCVYVHGILRVGHRVPVVGFLLVTLKMALDADRT